MAKNYVSCDRTIQFLLPPSLTDWLPQDHQVWVLIDVVKKLKTAHFHKRHPNRGPGRAAYDPDMLLSLVFYAYCNGIWSSRDIERACERDLAFRVITANQVPDHGTIARFLAGCDDLIEDLFNQVLELCAEAGLAKLGVVALDGTKIAANASLKATRTQAQIRKELVERMLQKGAAADAAEDAAFGPDRGDELPEALANPRTREAHLDEAMRRLEQRREQARVREREALADKTAKRVKTARKVPRLHPDKPRTNPSVAQAEADLEVAKAQAEAARQRRAEVEAAAAAKGRKPTGLKPDLERGIAQAEAELARAQAAEAEAATQDRVNTTDGDSEIMKTRSGFLQGYNAQAVVSEDQIILAAAVTDCGNDVGQFRPMIDAAMANLAAAGIDQPIGCVVADAGYLSTDNLTAAGPDRLIATTKSWKLRRKARTDGYLTGPPPSNACPLDAMTHRLLTRQGATTYAKRQHTVEPVFGQIKENRGFRRFRRRGLPAVNAEWMFVALTHNLLKLFAKQNAPPAAAPPLPGDLRRRNVLRTSFFWPNCLPAAA